MKRKLVAVWILFSLFMVLMTGCSAHTHKIGGGAAGTNVTEQHQWYILWGLVPLNHVDSATMAAGATDYQIVTAITPLDFLMNIFTGFVTIYSRTVTVTK
jgi:hypothetical protein